MAKKQARKTVSLNRAVYYAVVEAAAAEGVSGSEWVTRLIRNAIPSLPPQKYAKPVEVYRVVTLKLAPKLEPRAEPKTEPPALVAEDIVRRAREYEQRSLANPCRREYCRIDGIHPADDARHGKKIAARSNGVG